jgi:hypothetical protein
MQTKQQTQRMALGDWQMPRRVSSRFARIIGETLEASYSRNTCADSLQFFTCAVVPRVKLAEYIETLGSWRRVCEETLLLACLYMKRFAESPVGTPWTSRSVHGMLLSALTLALAWSDDYPFSWDKVGRLGGVPVGDLSKMVTQFLWVISWDLYVHPDELLKLRRHLFPLSRVGAA